MIIRVVIDCGPDFRQQMLVLQDVKSLMRLLFTHEHADHTAGLDDIRPFYFKQKKDIPSLCPSAGFGKP